MGALVALEMASHLQQAGRAPDVLVLLDPPAARSRGRRRGKGERRQHLAGFARELGFRLEDVVGRVSELDRMDLDTQLWMIYDLARREGRLPEDLDYHQIERFFEVYRANSLAADEYLPGPELYQGPVVLIQASRGASAETSRSWLELLGHRLETYSSPGDHHSMLRGSHAAALAGILEEALAAQRLEGVPSRRT